MTATQLWKNSGTELSFKEWIKEQKMNGNFVLDNELDEHVWNAVGEDYKKKPYSIYGIDARVLGLSAIIIVAAILIAQNK